MNPPSSANPQRTLLRMGSTTGQRMAEPTGSQCWQCQHSGEPVALLRDRFEVSICWRRAQRMKASDAPQQECCPSGLPAHRGLAEPSEHSVTVMLESPDKYQVPTKDCPCPNHPPLSSGCLTHGTSFKLCFLYISFSASASRSLSFPFRIHASSLPTAGTSFTARAGENVTRGGNSSCYYENLLDKGKRKRWQQHVA